MHLLLYKYRIENFLRFFKNIIKFYNEKKKNDCWNVIRIVIYIYIYINVYIYILYTIWVWKFENICQFMIVNTNFYNEIYIKYLLWQKIFGLYLK